MAQALCWHNRCPHSLLGPGLVDPPWATPPLRQLPALTEARILLSPALLLQVPGVRLLCIPNNNQSVLVGIITAH